MTPNMKVEFDVSKGSSIATLNALKLYCNDHFCISVHLCVLGANFNKGSSSCSSHWAFILANIPMMLCISNDHTSDV